MLLPDDDYEPTSVQDAKRLLRDWGYRVSKVSKDAKKGGFPKGKTHSWETRKKIAMKLTGRVLTEEHKLAMSLAAQSRPGAAARVMRESARQLMTTARRLEAFEQSGKTAPIQTAARIAEGELRNLGEAEDAKLARAIEMQERKRFLENVGRLPFPGEPWREPSHDPVMYEMNRRYER